VIITTVKKSVESIGVWLIKLIRAYPKCWTPWQTYEKWALVAYEPLIVITCGLGEVNAEDDGGWCATPDSNSKALLKQHGIMI